MVIRLLPENSFPCLQYAAAFFIPCYFSFWDKSNLRAAGLRSVVRITTDLSVILYCLIWKNIEIFSFPASFLWQKSLSYLQNTYLNEYFLKVAVQGLLKTDFLSFRHLEILLNKKYHYAQTDFIFVKLAFSKDRIGQRTTYRKVGLISNLYSKE